jgi:hypothetical protein
VGFEITKFILYELLWRSQIPYKMMKVMKKPAKAAKLWRFYVKLSNRVE